MSLEENNGIPSIIQYVATRNQYVATVIQYVAT